MYINSIKLLLFTIIISTLRTLITAKNYTLSPYPNRYTLYLKICKNLAELCLAMRLIAIIRRETAQAI